MKKFISAVLAVVMIAGLFSLVPMLAKAADATDTAATATGKVEAGYMPVGTAVKNAEEFAAMNADGDYYLAADIRVDNTYASDFTGTFDGNGHTVTVSVPMFKKFGGKAKNLTIDGAVTKTTAATVVAGKVDTALADAVTGAFAVFGSGELCNIVNNASLSGKCAVGGLVGFADADVAFTDCLNNGKIVYSGAKGQWNALGGILGTTVASTTFISCVNSGTVDCGGVQVPAGGIAGTGNSNTNTIDSATMTLKNCANNAEVKGGWQTGGLVGWVARATLTAEDCVNNGNVDSSASYSGGVFGRLSEKLSTITHCVNNGEVKSYSSHVGGIAGYLSTVASDRANAEFYDCANNGYVNATGKSQNAGGILGSAADFGGYGANAYDSVIRAVGCVNTGKVDSNTYVGGIIGLAGKSEGTFYTEKNLVEIKNCRNSGDVGSTASNKVGGIFGAGYGCKVTVDSCVNTGEITGKTAAGIVGDAGSSKGVKVVKDTSDDIENVFVAPATDGSDADKVVTINFGQTQITVTKSVNTGAVSSPSYIAGGIVGYIWAGNRTVNSVKVPFFGKIYSCVNGGTVRAGQFASQFICYSNSASTVINDCMAFGTLADYSEKATAWKSFINVSSSNPLKADIKNVKYLENDGTEWFSYAKDASNAKNRRYLLDKPYVVNNTTYNGYVKLNPNNITFFTAEDLASGKIAVDCNAILGARRLYQTLGTDAAPTVDKTHAPVNLYGGKYFNINEGGASVRAVSDTGTVGIRFRSLISKEIFDAMKADVAEIGVIIAPKAVADKAGEMTFEALEAYKTSSGKANVYVTLKRSGEYAKDFSAEELNGNAYEIKGSLVNIRNAAMEFTAVGYVKLADGTVFYGSTDTNSAKAVAAAAVADTKTAFAPGYENEVAEGVFSPYTQKAYESLMALAK